MRRGAGVFAAVVLGLCGVVCAEELHVLGQYPSIQAAIDAAVDGDEVVVPPGTDRELLDLSGTGITLRSMDPCDPSKAGATALSGVVDGHGVSGAHETGRPAGAVIVENLDLDARHNAVECARDGARVDAACESTWLAGDEGRALGGDGWLCPCGPGLCIELVDRDGDSIEEPVGGEFCLPLRGPGVAGTCDHEMLALVNAMPMGQACNPSDLAPPFGVLNFDDVLVFLTAFGDEDPLADLAPAYGVYDFNDVLIFLVVFVEGCR